MKIEIDGSVLGNGRIVVATEKHIKKYYFNEKQFKEIKDCVEMMKTFHGDLFVDMFEKDFLCVTMNRINFYSVASNNIILGEGELLKIRAVCFTGRSP